MFAPFYVRLASLSNEEARRSLADPAAEEGVAWEEEALEAAVDFCEGNPWLLQMLGDAAWRAATGASIARDDVMGARDATERQLDEWFMPRLLRGLEDRERQVLAAMARIAERGPVPFATLLDRVDGFDAKTLVATTAQLARRDLVKIESGAGSWVSVEHDSVSFTVPRIGPYLRQNELV